MFLLPGVAFLLEHRGCGFPCAPSLLLQLGGRPPQVIAFPHPQVATEKLRYAIHHCTAIDTDFGADAAAWAEID